MKVRTNERTNERASERANERANERTNRPTNARTHARTNERTNRPTNASTKTDDVFGGGQTHGEPESQRHGDTETKRHRDTEAQRHRDTEAQRHRGTEAQRHRGSDNLLLPTQLEHKHASWRSDGKSTVNVVTSRTSCSDRFSVEFFSSFPRFVVDLWMFGACRSANAARCFVKFGSQIFPNVTTRQVSLTLQVACVFREHAISSRCSRQKSNMSSTTEAAGVKNPNVLIVNDDGIDAPGLTSLVAALAKTEKLNVFVVAPDRERSAFSHSITLGAVLPAEVRHVEGAKMAFAVGGTPADCTMLALGALFPGVDFDCVIGGINRGDNAGRHIIYSGTVACAREAACHGLVGLAASLDSTARSADYTMSATLMAEFVTELVLNFPEHLAALRGRVVNLNFPGEQFAAEGVTGWRATLPGAWTYRDHWLSVPAPSDAKTGQDAVSSGPNSSAVDQETAQQAAAKGGVKKDEVPMPGVRGDGTWDAAPGETYYFTNGSAPPYKDLYVNGAKLVAASLYLWRSIGCDLRMCGYSPPKHQPLIYFFVRSCSTEGTDYAAMKKGFVSVSVFELVYKSALALGQTGHLNPADAVLGHDIITGACRTAKDFLQSMNLREPCVGGSRVGFGIPGVEDAVESPTASTTE